MSERAQPTKNVKLRLAMFFVVCLAPAAALVVWRWLGRRPASHELCVAQAEHRLELLFGSRLAEEAEEHPRDYEKLRTSMITTCEQYWTRAYAQCSRDAPSQLALEACEQIGRVRR